MKIINNIEKAASSIPAFPHLFSERTKYDYETKTWR